MTDVRITLTETVVVEGESEPVSITVYDGVFVNSGGGGGGAVDSVNGHTGTVVLTASDVSAQPVDSDLTAIAALSTTTFGRALLALADAAALRTAAGLGTAATQATSAFDAAGAAASAQSASQPLDSDLTAIAALTTTTFGRSLLTAADAAAGRVLLGAGTSSLALGTSSSTAKAGDYQPTAANISDATTIGKSVLTAADAAAVRTAIGAAATAHTHAASDVTSGTIATARLGSGTADSTKFLRGDQSWAVPGGGGTVTSVTAGDGTVTVGGTASDPTVAVNAIAESQVTGLVSDLAAKAPLASPALTGHPTGVTETAGDSSTKLATTAFVAAAVAAGPIDATKVTHTINAQTGTSYTLVLGDAGKYVTMNNASASTLTVPPNSSVAFPTGTVIEGVQLGAGQVTLTPGSGVTINAVPGLKIAAQYGSYALLKVGTDSWVAMGRLAA